MPRAKTYSVRLTASELQLLHTEMAASIGCGAEDPDFLSIRDKAANIMNKHKLWFINKYHEFKEQSDV